MRGGWEAGPGGRRRVLLGCCLPAAYEVVVGPGLAGGAALACGEDCFGSSRGLQRGLNVGACRVQAREGPGAGIGRGEAPVAQRGKAKQERADLRLVGLGLGLVVTRDGGIPLTWHAYPGDRPDVTQFADMIDQLTAR